MRLTFQQISKTFDRCVFHWFLFMLFSWLISAFLLLRKNAQVWCCFILVVSMIPTPSFVYLCWIDDKWVLCCFLSTFFFWASEKVVERLFQIFMGNKYNYSSFNACEWCTIFTSWCRNYSNQLISTKCCSANWLYWCPRICSVTHDWQYFELSCKHEWREKCFMVKGWMTERDRHRQARLGECIQFTTQTPPRAKWGFVVKA